MPSPEDAQFRELVEEFHRPPDPVVVLRLALADLTGGWAALARNIALNYRFPDQQEAIHVALTDLSLTRTYAESVTIVRRRMNAYGNPEQRHPLEYQ